MECRRRVGANAVRQLFVFGCTGHLLVRDRPLGIPTFVLSLRQPSGTQQQTNDHITQGPASEWNEQHNLGKENPVIQAKKRPIIEIPPKT